MKLTSKTRRQIYKSLTCMFLGSVVLSSCADQAATSKPSVTEVPGTRSKRQSIGNCWIYAQASWLEALYLAHHGKTLDVSETYWTYLDWYTKLTEYSYEDLGTVKDENGTKKFEFSTGGSWGLAVSIIEKYGYVTEEEFNFDERLAEKSKLQAEALVKLEEALLEGGELYEDRSSDKVVAFLDKIFKVDMRTLVTKGQANRSTVIANGPKLASSTTVLKAVQTEWKWTPFATARGVKTPEEITPTTKEARRALFKRVMRALNDGQPVLMSFHVFFNALKSDPVLRRGVFSYEELQRNLPSTPEDQGGHMVLLTDYTVTNAPGYGDLGLGNLSDEEKAAALEGDLATLVSKNSWGFARAPRGLFDGQSDFTVDYLTLPTEQLLGEDTVFASATRDFILPKGY